MHDQIKLIKSDVNRTLPSLNEGKLKIRFIVPLMSSLLNILIFFKDFTKKIFDCTGYTISVLNKGYEVKTR